MPQVHIEMIPLRMGDYDVGGNPRRVFERKTGGDLLSSLAQGRLFAQLTTLRKNRFAPILLLEGDPLRVDHSLMRPESIRGALAYITAILRVPILPSSGPAESAHLAACCLANLTRCAHIKKRGRRTNAGPLQHKGARTQITNGMSSCSAVPSSLDTTSLGAATIGANRQVPWDAHSSPALYGWWLNRRCG